MPPKRKSARTAQLQPQPAQSDYDTDTANLTDNASMAVVDPPPVRSNAELNLLVLRRWCPEIQGIIAIAPFAVLYTFSPETQQWEKSETQGTLFVCQLAGDLYPRYRVIILNRKGPENFHLDLVSTENIEVTEEYVIVQILEDDDTPLIYGIWIFSDGDSVPDTREVISKTIMDCATRAEQDALSTGRTDAGNGVLSETNEANDYAYAINGERSQPEPAPPPPQQLPGQQISIDALFGNPRMVPHHLANLPANAPPGSDAHKQGTVFSTPQFFDNAPTGVPPPTQHPPAQNALLDLFKNAKRG